MSGSDQFKEDAVEISMDIVADLIRRGSNTNSLQDNPYHVKKTGELIVAGAAMIAPGAVASASAGTVAVISTVSSTVIALAPVVAPVAVVCAVGYSVYKIAEWLESK